MLARSFLILFLPCFGQQMGPLCPYVALLCYSCQPAIFQLAPVTLKSKTKLGDWSATGAPLLVLSLFLGLACPGLAWPQF